MLLTVFDKKTGGNFQVFAKSLKKLNVKKKPIPFYDLKSKFWLIQNVANILGKLLYESNFWFRALKTNGFFFWQFLYFFQNGQENERFGLNTLKYSLWNYVLAYLSPPMYGLCCEEVLKECFLTLEAFLGSQTWKYWIFGLKNEHFVVALKSQIWQKISFLDQIKKNYLVQEQLRVPIMTIMNLTGLKTLSDDHWWSFWTFPV